MRFSGAMLHTLGLCVWLFSASAAEAVQANRIAVRRIVANPDFPDVWKDIAVMELAADTTRYEIRIAPKGNPPHQGACGGDSGGPCVVRDGAGTFSAPGQGGK